MVAVTNPRSIETDLGVTEMTPTQLDKIAVFQAGVVGSLPEGMLPKKILYVAGGWRAEWTHGKDKKLMLRPTTGRTRTLCREGKIRLYQDAGLSRRLAERLDEIPAKYKIELVKLLVRIINNNGYALAFLKHPCSLGDERDKWKDKHEYLLKAFPTLTPQREVEIAIMVRELAKG